MTQMHVSAPDDQRQALLDAATDPTSVDPDHVDLTIRGNGRHVPVTTDTSEPEARPIQALLTDAIALALNLLEARHPVCVARRADGSDICAAREQDCLSHVQALNEQAAALTIAADNRRRVIARWFALMDRGPQTKALVDLAMRFHDPLGAERPTFIDLIGAAEDAYQEVWNA